MKSFQVWEGWGDLISLRIDTSIMFEGWGIRLDLKYSANIIITDGFGVISAAPPLDLLLQIFILMSYNIIYKACIIYLSYNKMIEMIDMLNKTFYLLIHLRFTTWVNCFICLTGAEVSGFTAVTTFCVLLSWWPGLTLTRGHLLDPECPRGLPLILKEEENKKEERKKGTMIYSFMLKC